MRRLLSFMSLLGAVTLAAAAPQEFASGTTRTHLVELFTSEGCSSCPPAEAWLGNLRTAKGLWRDFVPIAWHVDYWDRLGWKDRFASREGTQRQYAYAQLWESASVYTPCFVLDGREWRVRDRTLPVTDENAGVLRATYDGGKLAVEFTASAPANYEAHAVILAMDAASRVTRGENRGRELHHEFVAATPPRSSPLRDGRAELELTRPDIAGVSTFALAVWITRRGESYPQQATGGTIVFEGSR